MSRDYREDALHELAKAQVASEYVHRGLPVPEACQPSPPPSDEAIGDYMSDTIGGKMRRWSNLTNSSQAATIERINRYVAERKAESDESQREVDVLLRRMKAGLW